MTGAGATRGRAAHRLAWPAVAVPCLAAVLFWGPLSLGALLVLAATGTGIAGVGLVRRSGRACPPVGRRGLPWWCWAAAVCAWEMATLADHDLRTASLLATPLLAHPVLRGPVTVGWLGTGAWLLARPTDRPRPR